MISLWKREEDQNLKIEYMFLKRLTPELLTFVDSSASIMAWKLFSISG